MYLYIAENKTKFKIDFNFIDFRQIQNNQTKSRGIPYAPVVGVKISS